MPEITIIINDPPYGSEKAYNALRLANSLNKREEEVIIFLMGDAVVCGKSGQKTPDGFYNIERMLKPIIRRGKVLLCVTCMDARGIREEDLIEGCRKSTLEELTELSISSKKVLVF
ncbi:MAG: DsrE family protein [Nitrospirae bacterium]|nr:DsrE family protein [Nitrospirota bacterium]